MSDDRTSDDSRVYRTEFSVDELVSAWERRELEHGDALDDCLLVVAAGEPEEAWGLLTRILAGADAEEDLADVGSHLIEAYLMRTDARLQAIADRAKVDGAWAFALSMTWVRRPGRRKPDRYALLRHWVRTIN